MDEDLGNAFGILMCTGICAGAGICDGAPLSYSSLNCHRFVGFICKVGKSYRLLITASI